MLLSSSCTNKHIDTIDDNYRVFYQIFVGSFSDSNNDGIGDLRGIINRFDYLNDGNSESKTSLGIQGIWLSPIFESPSYHKYDVTNYYKIDEDFGTMDDLKELIELAHSRNVKVILDLAINHTSTDNEWFKQFKNAHINGETNNHYYDYYVYKNADEVIPGKTWNYLGKTENYECNFSTSMPELNFDNPVVRQEVYEVAKYYLDLGVDGFRFDAAKYIYLGDDKQSTDFWAEFINKLQKIKEDVYVVGEVWSSDNETYTYISALNCFNFTLANAEGKIAETAKNGDVNLYTKYIVNYQNKIKSLNEDAMLMPFISNHDMDRSAGFLMMANKFPYVAANLLLLGPGSPFIYYGEEIGMKGSRGGSNTDANRRLAMRWGDDDTVNNPEGSTFEEKKQTNGTVKEQLENEDSLLNYYRKLIDLRNKYPEIARGDYDYYKDSTNDMGGFIVTYNDDVTGIFHNCSLTNEQSVNLSNYDFEQIADYIGCSDIAKLENNILTLGPQTSAILK
ncbi:MAG: alpha-amylase family glycosyl hydrolase [Erysipelotrichaceae bacterium]|nr:alpha-amylase family glycosyl hydrolase [Erysipelotrichaceae bacterium]